MTERHTRIRASQISSVRPNDLQSTNTLDSAMNGYVPSYDLFTGDFTWVEQSTGGSSNASYSATFTDASLSSAGVLTVTHSLGEKLVQVAIYDNNDEYVVPDDIILTDANNLTVDFSSFEPLTGTWTVVVIASGGLNTKISDNDGDTKIEVEKNSDEDKIRFTTAGQEQLVLQDGALLPSTDEDVDLGSSSKKFKDLYLKGSSIYMGTNVLTVVSNTLKLDGNDIAGGASSAELNKIKDNVVLNGFRIAINGSLTQFNMIDGIIDEYEDESGIDTTNSLNEQYKSDLDFYQPYRDIIGIDDYVVLMLHFDGSDGATTTTDSSNSPHTISLTGSGGTSELDDTQKKFGTTSYYSDYTGWATAPASSDWDFTSVDVTIDFWFRFDAWVGGTHQILGQNESNADGNWYIYTANTGVISIGDRGLGVILSSPASTIALNTWYHVAVVKASGTTTMYIDGTSVAFGSGAYFDSNPTKKLMIMGQDAGNYNCHGWIEELRISKGIARWTSNFTPESSAYSATPTGFTNMTLISDSFTAEAIPDSSRLVVLEEDVDSITLNTDLKAFASRDNGSTWLEGTLVDEGDYDSSKRILTANFDLTSSGIGSGTSTRYKLTTHNTKDLKIHASGLSWD